MEFFGALIALILCFIVFLIVAAVIRYAIDSSKTSKRLEDLIKEVHYLRTEINKQNNNKQGDNKYIIDEKVYYRVPIQDAIPCIMQVVLWKEG
ncbi:hypothetical protein P4H27_08495 [Paenibacillus taichungensis]|nr:MULTISPECIES: hypothetical protein [Paenibacillus]MEC0106974.1 hypothetical protein [Paenibacillus taichungensis]MEC0195094.1 hypothetical protein [Paenibacillus taichungensis]PIH60034.1 hypothetical protein CS562_08925 [Paenibacillus sp. LK1]